MDAPLCLQSFFQHQLIRVIRDEKIPMRVGSGRPRRKPQTSLHLYRPKVTQISFTPLARHTPEMRGDQKRCFGRATLVVSRDKVGKQQENNLTTQAAISRIKM